MDVLVGEEVECGELGGPRSAKFDLYVDEVYKVPAVLVCLLATHIIYQGSACKESLVR